MAQSDYLCFTAEDDGCTIALTEYGTSGWTGSYSTDGNTWNTYTLGTTLTLANVGDKVYFKGDYAGGNLNKYIQFTMAGGKIAASGNTMSLVAENKFADLNKTYYNYLFYKLFANCTCLTTPPELPATSLTDNTGTAATNCYRNMFSACTSLRKAPELPATTLSYSCYAQMFVGCTSLTAPPKLPATTLVAYCYQMMFMNCSGIKLSSTKTDNYDFEYRIPNAGTGVTATQALSAMFTNTGGSFASTPTINTTYYLFYREPKASKIFYNNKVLLDLTSDSVTTKALIAGYTAHDSTGNKIFGEVGKDTYIAKKSTYFKTSTTGTVATTTTTIDGVTSSNFIGVICYKTSNTNCGIQTATIDDTGTITITYYSTTAAAYIYIYVLYWAA